MDQKTAKERQLTIRFRPGAWLRGTYSYFRVRQGQRHRLKDTAKISIVSPDSTGCPEGFLAADRLKTAPWPTVALHTGLLCAATLALYNPHSTE